MGRVAALFPGQCRGRRDPPGVTAHHLQDEHLRGRGAHGGHVQGRFAGRHGDILGDRPETGAGVRERQVVVHGFRNADADHGIAEPRTELRHLVGRVLGVTAAVVEEVADIVRGEDLDKPPVFPLVVLDGPELVTAGAERAARRVAQAGNRFVGLQAGVDEFLRKGANDAVPACKHLADSVGVLARRLDQAAGSCVDYRGYPARLRIKGIACAICFVLRWINRHCNRKPVRRNASNVSDRTPTGRCPSPT